MKADMTPHKVAVRVAGGAAAVARELGLSRAAVSKWTRCPADHVLTLERLSDGMVTRHDLRPDIFGERPHEGAAA